MVACYRASEVVPNVSWVQSINKRNLFFTDQLMISVVYVCVTSVAYITTLSGRTLGLWKL